jgi:hypothetical protein
VYLERADNITDGDYYNGEPNDMFPGPSVNNQIFHPLSIPNSNKLNGTRSGFGLTNISLISGTGVSANAFINYLVSNSSDATSFNNSRKLLRDSVGKYHLVYESEGEIYYQYSTNGVTTWLGLARLSTGNNYNKYPCITKCSGHIYVVWQRTTGTNHAFLFRHSGNSGSSWDDVRTIASSLNQSSEPLPVLVSSNTRREF